MWCCSRTELKLKYITEYRGHGLEEAKCRLRWKTASDISNPHRLRIQFSCNLPLKRLTDPTYPIKVQQAALGATDICRTLWFCCWLLSALGCTCLLKQQKHADAAGTSRRGGSWSLAAQADRELLYLQRTMAACLRRAPSVTATCWQESKERPSQSSAWSWRVTHTREECQESLC